MTPETYQKVTEHMNAAQTEVERARHAVQLALISMTDAEGVNLPLIKDIEHALSQITERFSLWRSNEPVPVEPSVEKAGALRYSHVVNAVFDSLVETFQRVREPGKNALVLFVDEHAHSLHIDVAALRRALNRLRDEQRITARKMNYPPYVPEAWEITFITGQPS